MNIVEFRRRIFKIKKDSFTYLDMQNEFKELQQWSDPEIWKEGSDLE